MERWLYWRQPQTAVTWNYGGTLVVGQVSFVTLVNPLSNRVMLQQLSLADAHNIAAALHSILGLHISHKAWPAPFSCSYSVYLSPLQNGCFHPRQVPDGNIDC
jgi:hypothetical protein